MSAARAPAQETGFGRAVSWALVMNWGHHGASSAITLVLAALLGPAAFGIVSMAMVYVLFLQILLDQGMSGALIHSEPLTEEHMNSAFWIVSTSSVVLLVVSVILSDWWAAVNRTPELAPVIRVLSITIVFHGLMIVQQAALEKKMNYKALAIRANLAVAAGGTAGVGLAVYGAGVWALVAQNVTTGFVELILLWKLSPWRPRARFSTSVARDLYVFSGRVFLARLGSFAQRRSDALLIGLFFGPVAVGLYRMADRLSALVIQLTTRSVAQVSLPAFANRQTDPPALREALTNATRSSAIFAIPALAGMAVVADPLLRLPGDQWVEAGPALKVLCALCAVRSLTLLTSPLLQAVGRPGIMAVLAWVLAAANICGFLAVGMWLGDASVQEQSFTIAAVRTGIFALLYAPTSLWLALKYSDNTPGRFLRTILPALVGAVAASGAALSAQVALAGYALPPIWELLAMVSAGAAAGLATLYLIEPAISVQLLALKSRFVRQIRG